MASKLLLFQIDGGRFGISSTVVREVLRAVTILPAADLPAPVMGVINLRGEVVAVLDARRILNVAAKELAHTDHLMVVEHQGRSLAIRVDRAFDLVEVDDATLQAAASAGMRGSEQRFANSSCGLVQVLDVNEFMADLGDVRPVANSRVETAS